MEATAKTIKPMRESYPPHYRLRPEVVALIKRDNRLQGDLMKYLDISFNTLWRWLNSDDLKLTGYGVLELIWIHLNENFADGQKKYPKMSDLLTTETNFKNAG